MKIAQRTAPRTASDSPEPFGDREVIVREPATMIHAPTGKTIFPAGITKVLLAPRPGTGDDPNGVVAYECAEDGRTFETAHGALGHYGSHSGKQFEPNYPLDTIKLVVRLVKAAERDGHRNKAKVAAEALNERGVETLDGEPWTAQRVSALYSRWVDKVRVRVDRRATTVSSPIVKNVAEPELVDVARDLVKSFSQATVALDAFASRVTGIGPAIARLTDAVAETEKVDEELVDKARRWEEMQRLLGK